MTSTGPEVATRLGVSPRRVRQLAKDLGLGTMQGRDRIFTDQEIRQMEARKTTRGPVALTELAAMVVNTGFVTDPILPVEQAVVISRRLFDQFVAELDVAPIDDPLAIAGRALVDHADVTDDEVDFPVPAFKAFDAIQESTHTSNDPL